MAKEWLISTIDEDMKSRLIGTSGGLVLQDQFVMDTAKRVTAIIESETPLYSRCRAYFAMWQEKGELFSSFMFHKCAKARSALISSMTDEDRLIHELLRSMSSGPLFIKFCEKGNITLELMPDIARTTRSL